jgi:hypothetical protein
MPPLTIARARVPIPMRDILIKPFRRKRLRLDRKLTPGLECPRLNFARSISPRPALAKRLPVD